MLWSNTGGATIMRTERSASLRAGSLIDSTNTRLHRPQPKRRRAGGGRSFNPTPIIVLLAIVAGGWYFATQPQSRPSQSSESASRPDRVAEPYPSAQAGTVERVVDGDTIVVQVGGVAERVRLLNIDTPESVKPDSPVECLGPEASAFLTALLPAGTPVTLEFDRELRDRYDRMLAGVRTADGSLVNAAIARAGFAEPLEIGGNDRFTPDVTDAVAEAQGAAVGLWSGVCG